MSVEEVMMSGVPFDLLTEDDLFEIDNLVNYDRTLTKQFRAVNIKRQQLWQFELKFKYS